MGGETHVDDGKNWALDNQIFGFYGCWQAAGLRYDEERASRSDGTYRHDEAEEVAVMDKLPTKEDCEKTGKIVEAIARAALPDFRIVRSIVEADWDHDGDPVLWVRVVVDIPPGEDLDPSATIRLRQQVFRELQEAGIDAYAVVTFPSYAEMGDAA